jgi:glycosyltransferase involved in cell wall biosynthesis
MRTEFSTEPPMVSVIITSHNYGCYLQDAINSALGQTYPNIEIIVVDDGSTDHTREVAAQNPVTYVAQKHQGVSAAKNKGIQDSHGDFLVCLDGDDKLSRRYVEKTLLQISKRPSTGFVYTGSIVWNESTGDETIWMPRKLSSKYSLFAGWHGALGPIMVRRKAFESLQGGFDTSFRAYEDMDLCFRIMTHGWKADVVYAPLHWYRIHPNSLNPVTPVQRKIAEAKINQKYWFRPMYRKLNGYYLKTFGRLTVFLMHPVEYMRGLRRKIQVDIEVKSIRTRDSNAIKTANGIRTEINSRVDLLVEWNRNNYLKAYYSGQIEALEAALSELAFESPRKTSYA